MDTISTRTSVMKRIAALVFAIAATLALSAAVAPAAYADGEFSVSPATSSVWVDGPLFVYEVEVEVTNNTDSSVAGGYVRCCVPVEGGVNKYEYTDAFPPGTSTYTFDFFATDDDMDNGEVQYFVEAYSDDLGVADWHATITFHVVKHALTIEYVYANGGTISTYVDHFRFDTEYDVKSPDIEGYTPDKDRISGNLREDTSYVVTYTGNPAQITFDLGGGTLDGKTGMITIDAHVGDKVSAPGAPTLEGYTFKHWEGSQLSAGEEFTVEGDHSYKAVYEKNAEPSQPDTKTDTAKPATPATGDDAGMLAIPISIVAGIVLIGSAVRRRAA